MMYNIVKPIWIPLKEYTATGAPWFDVRWETVNAVRAFDDEQAIMLAKQLGYANPILERIFQ